MFFAADKINHKNNLLITWKQIILKKYELDKIHFYSIEFQLKANQLMVKKLWIHSRYISKWDVVLRIYIL